MYKMRSKTCRTFFILLTILIISASANDTLVKIGSRKFGLDFYKLLASDNDGNILFSPFSAHAVLSILHAGAGGTTKEVLGKALYCDDPRVSAESYYNILSELNSDSNTNFEVSVANKVYVKPTHQLRDEFKNICTTKYLSEVGTVDFANGVAASREINTWVEEQTKNKIKDLFLASDFTTDTHVALVNAVYLKGKWQRPFTSFLTRESDFHVNDENVVKVQMMYTGGYFNYKKNSDLGYEIVEMPFKNRNYSMVIFVPTEKNGIKELETTLQTFEINELTDGMTITHIDLNFPKFKVTETIQMEEYLTKLNLGELFDSSKCDLTNMLRYPEDIYISKASQKTYLDVNEYGCEATAASGFVATGRSLPLAHVNVDHPFLLSIIHKDSQGEPDILLIGRISNPVAENEE